MVSGETEEIFNFIPLFEELQILGEMRTHTSPFPSKSTFVMVIGKQYVHCMLLYEIA